MRSAATSWLGVRYMRRTHAYIMRTRVTASGFSEGRRCNRFFTQLTEASDSVRIARSGQRAQRATRDRSKGVLMSALALAWCIGTI